MEQGEDNGGGPSIAEGDWLSCSRRASTRLDMNATLVAFAPWLSYPPLTGRRDLASYLLSSWYDPRSDA